MNNATAKSVKFQEIDNSKIKKKNVFFLHRYIKINGN